MIISSPEQLKTYTEAGKIATEILQQVSQKAREGVYSLELEEVAQGLCKKYKVEPSFARVQNDYGPYGFAMCISVNDTVLHGMPNKQKAFALGDVVKLDFGIVYEKLHTDQCITVGIGKLSKKNKKLVEVAREAVINAVDLAIAGNRTGDLGAIMHLTSKQKGFDVLKQYIGHGIGLSLHERPSIPAYGRPGSGEKLVKGMVICVEAQVIAGSGEVYITDDTWTVKMKDGKNTAMFEYLVVVGETEPTILTPTQKWPLIAG